MCPGKKEKRKLTQLLTLLLELQQTDLGGGISQVKRCYLHNNFSRVPLAKNTSMNAEMSPTHCDPMDCSSLTRLLYPWNSPGKLAKDGLQEISRESKNYVSIEDNTSEQS